GLAGGCLGLVAIQYPDARAQVDMPRRHHRHLAGSATSVLQREQEVAEAVALGVVVEDLLPLLGRKETLPNSGRRLLDRLERVAGDLLVVEGPVAGALRGDDGTAATALPALVGVQPGLDDLRRNLVGPERAVEVVEGDEEHFVPFKGPLIVVLR